MNPMTDMFDFNKNFEQFSKMMPDFANATPLKAFADMQAKYREVAVEAAAPVRRAPHLPQDHPHATGAPRMARGADVSAEIVRVPLSWLMFRGHMFDVDHATVLCTDPTLAERLAELIERHGLADVPDHRYQPLDHDVLAAAQAAVREHELERRHIREEQIR